jgi:integrase
LDKKARTYNHQITHLRLFVRDFLRKKELIETFKMAPVDASGAIMETPSRKALRMGFQALNDDRQRAAYLFTATSGLRPCEILAVTREQVNLALRAVIPNHFTRKKRSGITFYSEDTDPYLKKYLKSRNDCSSKLFVISDRQWRKIWKIASKAAGVKITPKILRVWFSNEMGDKLIPDRYVDIFQGRAPRTVLAKHYTGKGLRRLKRIYDKAKMHILCKSVGNQGIGGTT